MTPERAQERFPVGSTVYCWGEHHKVLAIRDSPLGAELRLSRPVKGKRDWIRWVEAKRVAAHRRNAQLD